MWTPKQLLSEASIKALREGGFADLEIEFLGWLSYCANTLNNSRNPVKAAHTLLAKDAIEEMVEKFTAKKKETVSPTARAEHDAVSRKFRKLEQWIQRVEEDAEAARETQFES